MLRGQLDAQLAKDRRVVDPGSDLVLGTSIVERSARKCRWRVHLSVNEADRGIACSLAHNGLGISVRAFQYIRDTRHFELEFSGLCGRFAAPSSCILIYRIARVHARAYVTASPFVPPPWNCMQLECSRLRWSGEITTRDNGKLTGNYQTSRDATSRYEIAKIALAIRNVARIVQICEKLIHHNINIKSFYLRFDFFRWFASKL